jgi:SEC-C motif-containing protein
MARCDCGSGDDYRDCCRPLHKGESEASEPSRLVRARFCAFARKEVDFLWKTLHSDHPDKSRPEAEVKLELRNASQRYKYVRVHIVESRGDDVLFVAEIYERGKEVSFRERSHFAQENGGWRYHSGEAHPWKGSDAARATWE